MSTQTNDISKRKYCLTTIEETDPPEDMPKGDWYHYVVMYGAKEINCVRAGTLKEDTQHAQDFVENLNSRSTMSYSNYTAHNTKTKPKTV